MLVFLFRFHYLTTLFFLPLLVSSSEMLPNATISTVSATVSEERNTKSPFQAPTSPTNSNLIFSTLVHLNVQKSLQIWVLFFFQLSIHRPIPLLVTYVPQSHSCHLSHWLNQLLICIAFSPQFFWSPSFHTASEWTSSKYCYRYPPIWDFSSNSMEAKLSSKTLLIGKPWIFPTT